MVEHADLFTGTVHEPTQATDRGFDLTVREILDIVQPGRVDFGGGELEHAETKPHPSNKRSPDDEYEWWNLEPGSYLIEYNESVAVDHATLTVQARDALLADGAFHPTLEVDSLPLVPLCVGGAGIRIKQNARVSTVIDVDRR